MLNQWGRPLRSKNQPPIGMWIAAILVVGFIAYQLFPILTNRIYSLLNPTYATTNVNGYNLPNTYNPSASNLPTYSVQDFTGIPSETGRNELTTGYWLFFASNGKFTQLSINAETYTFVQRLIERDRNGTAKNKILLVENGRIRQYIVSDEISSVVANISLINSREGLGNSSANASPSTSQPSSSSSNTYPNTSNNSGSSIPNNSGSSLSPNSPPSPY